MEVTQETNGAASPTCGAKPMSIQGRLFRERERLAGCGMTDAEREWRKQWIRDQRLSTGEPKPVAEIYQELYNPLRRFYRYPMDVAERHLAKIGLGAMGAALFRRIAVASAFSLFGVYATFYCFKYNTNDWTRKGGWRVVRNRPAVCPGDPNWPYKPERHVGADYADQGFKDSPIQKSLEVPETDLLVNRVAINAFADFEISSKELKKVQKL